MQNFQGIVFIETQIYGEIFKFVLVYLQKILTSKVIANFLMDLLHDFRTHPWRTFLLPDTSQADNFPTRHTARGMSPARYIPEEHSPDEHFPNQTHPRHILPWRLFPRPGKLQMNTSPWIHFFLFLIKGTLNAEINARRKCCTPATFCACDI